MSKKMLEHKRLFKQLKAGLFTWKDLDERQIQLMRTHYPFLFSNSLNTEKDN